MTNEKQPFMTKQMHDNMRLRWGNELKNMSADALAKSYEMFYGSEFAGSNDAKFLSFLKDYGFDVVRCEGHDDGWEPLFSTVAEALEPYQGDKRPVIQDWVQRLSFMQQSVLLSTMRNADGVAKRHPSKDLIRWYRRCVVLSAFDGRALTNPAEEGGGSYTGPVFDLPAAVDAFIDARDEMSLHYFAHAAHAFEIIGYKHPDTLIRSFWYDVYTRMVHALHMWPETEEQMDARLGDDPEGWMARNDPSTTCSD